MVGLAATPTAIGTGREISNTPSPIHPDPHLSRPQLLYEKRDSDDSTETTRPDFDFLLVFVHSHRSSCSGRYVKIAEPPGFKGRRAMKGDAPRAPLNKVICGS